MLRTALLVAESDADFRDSLSCYLIEQGYEVAVAENGVDCLQQLRNARPDLLILDMDLTWGGGDGVLEWLRFHDSAFDIPVIVTARNGRRSVADIEMRPVIEVLAKPFSPTKLAAIVREAVSRKRGDHQRRQLGLSEMYIG